MALTHDQVIAALRTVQDPELFKDIVTLGMVKDVQVDGPRVRVARRADDPGLPAEGADRGGREGGAAPGGGRAGRNRADRQHARRGRGGAPQRNVLPQVKNIIAVGAGKGGVGKSTVAANLAVGLQRAGATVGLMDGDIYGPSMPTMLGIKGRPPTVRGNRILPHHVHGIHAVTIGVARRGGQAADLRGPMAHGAFKQLLLDNTEWPDLDYLDRGPPPGTGDVPLTLCQLLPLTGAVVVATPQQVALDDAVRAVRMFQQLGVPILGMVENMSYFVGPDGTRARRLRPRRHRKGRAAPRPAVPRRDPPLPRATRQQRRRGTRPPISRATRSCASAGGDRAEPGGAGQPAELCPAGPELTIAESSRTLFASSDLRRCRHVGAKLVFPLCPSPNTEG